MDYITEAELVTVVRGLANDQKLGTRFNNDLTITASGVFASCVSQLSATETKCL
jgi:hypothetical protein